jgi:hypothetical protein
LVTSLVLSVARGEDAAELFESRIRPALVEHCYKCHSAASGKSEGGLRLDTRDGLLKGGDNGAALVPSKPAESLLIRAVRYTDPDLKMPPDGKLPEEVVAAFEVWVAAGAPDPRDGPDAAAGAKSWDDTLAERRRHWSFRPVAKVSPPDVADAAWAANPVDRFVGAEMEKKGVRPAVEADRRTLLRRVTYGLTGLPPTSEEIEAFVADGSPDAYEKVVDRLLASPRFGERFATHWLDLVRYADTHGSEGDPEIPAAWRYRDYVIRAFDADLPYDRFVREQIAGDLLPDPRIDAAGGTNESAIGPAQFRLVEHGFQPVDSLDEQMKTVENQIDVVSKAFQGLTVACARCHDHKFDPIRQKDYYALCGIFTSARPAQVVVDDTSRLDRRDAELAAAKARLKAALADAWIEAAGTIPEKLLRGGESDAGRPSGPAEELADLVRRLDALDREARRRVLSAPGDSSPPVAPPRPVAAWRFEGGSRDVIGGMHLELVGGAEVRDGRLVLSGEGAFARSAPADRNIREKTLEAWVALASLDQRGGGVVTLQTNPGDVFDSIVYGEANPRRWTAGSDFFRRTREPAGPSETEAGVLVHMAAVYGGDGSIRVYRNGEPYGSPYTPAPAPVMFRAGESQVLLGMRHANRGPLAGEIEEARLYDRALSADEVRDSFRVGPGMIPEADLAAALPADLRNERDRLKAGVAAFREKHDADELRTDRWAAALADAEKDAESPLRPWVALRGRSGDDLKAGWRDQVTFWDGELTARRAFNAEHFTPLWDLTTAEGLAGWAASGPGPSGGPGPAGEFAVEPDGDRVVTAVYPAGVVTHGLSQKSHALLASPVFELPKSVCVRLAGDHGGGVRVVVDGYPLGANETYPQRRPNGGPSSWVRLDTAYRQGSDAYVEFATYEDLTRPAKADGNSAAPRDGRSYFFVSQVLASDGSETPKEEAVPVVPLLQGEPPVSREELAARYADALRRVVAAWRAGVMTDAEAAFLDGFVRRGLLPNSTAELPGVAPLVAEYRAIEAAVPVPRRAPGLLDAAGRDAPLLVRGNHRTPGEPVSRRYLEVLGGEPYRTAGSGRLELAGDLASAGNPLTARVMANRVWGWLFGRAIVPTPDNFGRLGEPPTHPELLDWLAARFVEDGWSVKRLVRRIVTSRTYRMSGAADETAVANDSANLLFSRFPVRRLDAEAIRDGMLAAAGELNARRFGPGVRTDALDGGRRSVYLVVRRTAPHPFLEVFDKPAPASTRGRRDVTTLPAQSLALLNSTFVTELSGRWGARLAVDPRQPEARIRRVFESALGRTPTAEETDRSLAYLAASAADDNVAPDAVASDPQSWADFVHAVLCMKESIYLR